MPKVSVIIPTYNRSELVREAIESVLDQSFTDFEVLVIDDGSVDDTSVVVKNILDKRIRYLYKENGGQCAARNLGIIKTTGKYITYLDHDDIWPTNYLETMVKYLDKNSDYDLAYTRIVVLYSEGHKREIGSSKRRVSGWLAKNFFDCSPCILPSAVCFRRSGCRDVFWDEELAHRGEDYDLFLRMSAKTKFLFVPETYALKREQSEKPFLDAGQLNLINTARSLERFYYNLGGDKFISQKQARIKISHRYRKAAKLHLKSENRLAAILLYKRALSYWPFDIRLYLDWLRAFLRNKNFDKTPDWQIPEPLPLCITVTQKEVN